MCINKWFPVESIYSGGGQHTHTPPHVSGPGTKRLLAACSAPPGKVVKGIKSLQYEIQPQNDTLV